MITEAEADCLCDWMIEALAHVPPEALPGACHDVCAQLAEQLLSGTGTAPSIARREGVFLAFGYVANNCKPIFDVELVSNFLATNSIRRVPNRFGPYHVWIRIPDFVFDPTLMASIRRSQGVDAQLQILVLRTTGSAGWEENRLTFHELKTLEF